MRTERKFRIISIVVLGAIVLVCAKGNALRGENFRPERVELALNRKSSEAKTVAPQPEIVGLKHVDTPALAPAPRPGSSEPLLVKETIVAAPVREPSAPAVKAASREAKVETAKSPSIDLALEAHSSEPKSAFKSELDAELESLQEVETINSGRYNPYLSGSGSTN